MYHSITIHGRESRDVWDFELTCDGGSLNGRVDSFPFVIHIGDSLYEMNEFGDITHVSHYPGDAVGSKWRGKLTHGCDYASGWYNASIACLNLHSVSVRGYVLYVKEDRLVFTQTLEWSPAPVKSYDIRGRQSGRVQHKKVCQRICSVM